MLTAIFLFPASLFCCPIEEGPELQPTLINPDMISDAEFDFGEETDQDTYAEWRDYFKHYRKKDYAPDDVQTMIDTASTPFADVNEYLTYLNGMNDEDSDSDPAKYLIAVQRATNKKLDAFLRVKYAFHAVGMPTMAGKYDLAVKNFKAFIEPMKVHSLIRYMAMSWEARALYLSDHNDEAVANYLELYQKWPDYRDEAIRSTRMVDDGSLAKIIGKMKKGRKKVEALYFSRQVNGRDYSSDTLSQFVDYAPDAVWTQNAAVQMLRDVEKDYLRVDISHILGATDVAPTTNPIVGFFRKVFHSDRNYADLIPICEKAADDHRVHNAAFWRWAACYLSLLTFDTANARKNIDLAQKKPIEDKTLNNEIHLFETLVEMAEQQKDFLAGSQERFVDDLHQNSPIAETPGQQADPNNYQERILNHQKSALVDTLWLLAAQKYLYLNDWARAALVVSITPPDLENDDNLANFNTMLDLATPEEMASLKTILLQKGSATPNPNLLETMLLDTPLTIKDLDLLMLFRKIKLRDYAGALADVKASLAKDPNFLNVEKRAANNASQPASWRVIQPDAPDQFHYVGSYLSPKTFSFGYDLGRVTGQGEMQKMELVPFLEKMVDFQDKLDQGKKTGKAVEAQAAFDLGRVYATLQETPWPDIQSERSFLNPSNPIYVYRGENYVQFYGNALSLVQRDRINAYVQQTPDFYALATQCFQEAVDTQTSKELSAESLTCMSILNCGNTKSYLKTLKSDYQDTDFYKRYKTICSWFN